MGNHCDAARSSTVLNSDSWCGALMNAYSWRGHLMGGRTGPPHCLCLLTGGVLYAPRLNADPHITTDQVHPRITCSAIVVASEHRAKP